MVNLHQLQPALDAPSRPDIPRLFPATTPALTPDQLMLLGRAGGGMDGWDTASDAHTDRSPAHPTLEAGYTYLGQFIDHDLSFDPLRPRGSPRDPASPQRSPALNLDSVYLGGPAASPHLYERQNPARFLLAADARGRADADLPRTSEGAALIGDPRNDEHAIIAHIHLAFLKFHNALEALDRSAHPTPGSRDDWPARFDRTRREVTRHFQWLVLNEFLPRIVGRPMVDAAVAGRRFFTTDKPTALPAEFSLAAFRFGHSLVAAFYLVQGRRPTRILPDPGVPSVPHLGGGRQFDAPTTIDWRRFFDLKGDVALDPALRINMAKRIDTRLAGPLFQLPDVPGQPQLPPSLAQRTLLAGLHARLPSGQEVAAQMQQAHNLDADADPRLARIQPIDHTLIPSSEDASLDVPLRRHTPLWYYILAEAHVVGGGTILGPVGGRIVAEVIIELLHRDPGSVVHNQAWRSTHARDGKFTIGRLLTVAGAA